jgi:putative transposase
VGLNRSSLYYEPVPVNAEDLRIQRLIDEEYTRSPFYGRRRMTEWLRQDMHEDINPKRVARLMRVMGLEAIYPKPHLSLAGAGHRIYPYLLRGLVIARPNQVWSTDITYIRLAKGFVYLVAILDWFSRYVVSWSVSVTMDTAFCLEALEAALRRGTPDIFNTDQGSQFTSEDFTTRLTKADIRISMDGRGRAFDNIFVERLWRTVKYENVYLHDYVDVPSLLEGLTRYFRFYNEVRRHQSLGYRTPAEVHGAVLRLAA